MIVARIASFAVLMTLIAASSAQAAFPGANGKIAFSHNGQVWTMNPDGSNRTQFNTSGTDPAWSPDGSRLSYVNAGVRVVNADGSGDSLVRAGGLEPAWSPTGTRLVYNAMNVSMSDRCDIRTINADGTGETVYATGCDFDGTHCCYAAPAWAPNVNQLMFQYRMYEEDPSTCEPFDCPLDPGPPFIYVGYERRGAHPNWSPDSSEVAFMTTGFFNPEGEIAVARVSDGATRVLTPPSFGDLPVFSPDGTKIAFVHAGEIHVMNAADGSGLVSLGPGTQPDWQPLPAADPAGYARPRGATPLRLSLVPAYRQCTSPNSAHGAPLAHASCSPPQRFGSGVNLGVGDGTPPAAKSIGSIKMRVLTGDPGPPDDSDVSIQFSLTNLVAGGGSDYTGDVSVRASVRRTDRSGAVAATTQDFPFTFRFPCTATADTTAGASCQISTTADTIVPGSIPEGSHTIWELDQARVYTAFTGYPDVNPEQLLAVQGVFVP